jgi:hypothetical protein
MGRHAAILARPAGTLGAFSNEWCNALGDRGLERFRGLASGVPEFLA